MSSMRVICENRRTLWPSLCSLAKSLSSSASLPLFSTMGSPVKSSQASRYAAQRNAAASAESTHDKLSIKLGLGAVKEVRVIAAFPQLHDDVGQRSPVGGQTVRQLHILKRIYTY